MWRTRSAPRAAAETPPTPLCALVEHLCAILAPTKNRPCLCTRGPASVYGFVVCVSALLLSHSWQGLSNGASNGRCGWSVIWPLRMGRSSARSLSN